MIDWDKPDPAGDMTPGYAGPPAGFLETAEAARKQYDAARLFTAPNLYRGKVGRDVVDALRARGRTGFTGADGRKVAYGADSLRTDYALHPTVAPRIWADVAAERERDPSFLEGIGTPEQFDVAVLAARRRDYDEAGDVLSRASGFTGLTGELTGGLIGAMQDPVQLTALAVTAGLPAGRLGLGVLEKLFGGRLTLGTATKIASEALGNAAVNVVATVPTLPIAMERSAEIGVEMTGRDVAMELAGAAVAGGVLGAAPPVAGATVRSVRAMVRDLRGLDRPLTPAEADALPVLEQAARDIAASPFVPTPEGDAAHTTRLTEAVDALESDRPMNPAVFETPTPAVKPGGADAIAADPAFDPTPFLDRAEAYARDRKAGPLTTEALGEHLGISRGQAQDVLSRLAGGQRGRGLFRVSYNPKSGVAKFSRPMLRSGPVDLITQLADMGGIRDNEGHSLLSRPGRDGKPREGAIGKVFVPGAGPLFRKSGMSLEEVGEFLMQNGWVRANDVGGGIPTEAEVIDLIDRAVRTKMFHPKEAAVALERERVKTQANSTEFQDRAAEIRGEVERINADNPDYTPLSLTDDDVAAIVPTLPDHASLEDAIFAHWDAMAREAEAEAAAVGADAGFDDYADDVPFDGGDDAGATGQAGQDGGGSAAAGGDAREGAAGGGGPENAAFNTAAGGQALEAFDTPQGDGPKAQVEALQHDLKAEEAEWQARHEARLARERAAIAAAPDTIEGKRPIEVLETTNGKLSSINRRRVLAAQEAGVQKIKGWYSPINPETGNPLKYGDVLRMAEAAAPAEAAPIGDTATGSLGLDAAQDAPAGGMTERQRAEMQARLQQSQMRRGGQQAADQISGGLFDAARDQLDAFAMPDGSTVSRADLLAEFDADDAALKTIKDCL